MSGMAKRMTQADIDHRDWALKQLGIQPIKTLAEILTKEEVRVKYAFNVTEYYEDGPPELFGTAVLDYGPKVGDVIQLKWLDGRDAYKAKVIHANNFDLDVEKVNES